MFGFIYNAFKKAHDAANAAWEYIPSFGSSAENTAYADAQQRRAAEVDRDAQASAAAAAANLMEEFDNNERVRKAEKAAKGFKAKMAAAGQRLKEAFTFKPFAKLGGKIGSWFSRVTEDLGAKAKAVKAGIEMLKTGFFLYNAFQAAIGVVNVIVSLITKVFQVIVDFVSDIFNAAKDIFNIFTVKDKDEEAPTVANGPATTTVTPAAEDNTATLGAALLGTLATGAAAYVYKDDVSPILSEAKNATAEVLGEGMEAAKECVHECAAELKKDVMESEHFTAFNIYKDKAKAGFEAIREAAKDLSAKDVARFIMNRIRNA